MEKGVRGNKNIIWNMEISQTKQKKTIYKDIARRCMQTYTNRI